MKKIIVSLVSSLVLLMPISTLASTKYYLSVSCATPHKEYVYKVIKNKRHSKVDYFMVKTNKSSRYKHSTQLKAKDFNGNSAVTPRISKKRADNLLKKGWKYDSAF